MRLDGLVLATVEPLRAVASLEDELRRWRQRGVSAHPAVAEAAHRGAEQCRTAAARLVSVAGDLERIEEAATP